ncbi:MAG: transporter substrate-binding domain-containing protein, partial [Candidatus Cloacimonadaceae bacterium]|nr:transporter substrate-binding domain-containing protein [Candidatus Cloacimonadaceae bacterium]
MLNLKRISFLILCISLFSLALLYADRVIIVGGDYNFPPYEYLDEHNNPAGYNVELSREIASIMGYEVEFRLGKWAKV